MQVNWFFNGTDNNNNQMEFIQNCQQNIADKNAVEEVCAFLTSINNYTIYYGGYEEAQLFQNGLAGAQWAINSAIVSTFISFTPGEQNPFFQ